MCYKAMDKASFEWVKSAMEHVPVNIPVCVVQTHSAAVRGVDAAVRRSVAPWAAPGRVW